MITAKFDSRKRVVIPQGIPGGIVAIETDANGIITLTPVEKAEPAPRKVKWIKKNGKTVGVTGVQITSEQVREALSDFP